MPSEVLPDYRYPNRWLSSDGSSNGGDMNWPFSSKKCKELEKTKEINRSTLMQVLRLSDVERLAYWDTFAIRQSDPTRRFPLFLFPPPPPPRPDHQHSYNATDTRQ